MKNTWAYGVTALFLSFVALMVTFAVIAGNNKEKLVVKNYYQAELAFQQQIDKVDNANALAEKPSIKLNDDKSAVEVFFPQPIYADGVTGKMLFYRPNAPDLDKEIEVKLNTNGTQKILTSDLEKGRWKVQLNWETNGIAYYTEQVISL